MNENHNQEDALNKAVEKAVQHKRKSGHELLDTLAQTTPKADTSFQQSLEDNLIAQLHANKTDKEVYIMAKRKRTNNSRWSLTLVAAVIAIVIVGGLILLMPRGNANKLLSGDAAENPTSAPIMVVTLTPTSGQWTEPRIPIVMAAQDIALGEVITADMVTIAFLPENEALGINESAAKFKYFTEIDSVIGMQAQTHIRPFEPIPSKLVASPPINPEYCIGARFTDYCTGNPTYIALSLETKDPLVTKMTPGELVNVIAFSKLEQASSNMRIEHVIEAAILVSVNLPNEYGTRIVELAVSDTYAAGIQELSYRHLPYIIVPHVEDSAGMSESQTISLPDISDK